MQIEILFEDQRWQTAQLQDIASRAGRAVMEHFGYDANDVCCDLLACDDTRIAELNSQFRDKPTPTNVLSWPSDERGAAIDGVNPDRLDFPMDSELGDIAISYDTCVREAQQAGITFCDHVTHLIIHAVLHLLGYDHIRDQDATLMEGIETIILGKLGIKDPYYTDSPS